MDSSGGSDISADKHDFKKEKKFTHNLFFVQALTYSNKNLKFSDSFVVYFCSYHVLLAEFRTSANLTGFHVFSLMHVMAQLHSIIFKICFGDLSFYT